MCRQTCTRICWYTTWEDRKSTRLNSSHEWISYAVFCLKKKKIARLRKELELLKIEKTKFVTEKKEVKEVRKSSNPSSAKTVKQEKVDFFFKDTATTEIYTLSLHDALPIYLTIRFETMARPDFSALASVAPPWVKETDRKSTRLNSSHEWISYAVFCLK